MVILVKEKMIRFMQGRYGADQFSRFLLVIAMIFTILSLFIGKHFFYFLAIVFLLYSYIRMFSKNFKKRYKENQYYLKYVNKLSAFFRYKKAEMAQSKHYHIYKCPKCRQKIRIPRGKGKIAITCPTCHNEFRKRS